MAESTKILVEQFRTACIYDDVLTDEQVEFLARKVVTNSEDELKEFLEILLEYRPNVVKRLFPSTPFGIRNLREIK